MFWQGIAVALLTGFVWACVGVVYSRAAEKHSGFYLFLFLSGLIFILSSWGVTTPSAAALPEVVSVAAVMVPAGILNQLGFLALCSAMRRGSHGISWGIAQSAMLCPFAAGVLLFGEHASGFQTFGMAVLLGSLVPLSWPKKEERSGGNGHRMFLALAFLAFVLLGVQQTLTLIPNQLPDLGEAALSWRVPLMSLGALIWAVPVLKRREFDFGRVWLFALLYGAMVALGQWTMFQGLDLLSRAGAAGVAYPVAIGSCIALFFLYTRMFRKEKSGAAGIAGIALAVLGILLLAC